MDVQISPSSELRNANTIRQLRFHHGEMTQKELAKFVGVSRQKICAIERGKYSPSLEVAFRIANILFSNSSSHRHPDRGSTLLLFLEGLLHILDLSTDGFFVRLSI